jgi:hypothetical protein
MIVSYAWCSSIVPSLPNPCARICRPRTTGQNPAKHPANVQAHNDFALQPKDTFRPWQRCRSRPTSHAAGGPEESSSSCQLWFETRKKSNMESFRKPEYDHGRAEMALCDSGGSEGSPRRRSAVNGFRLRSRLTLMRVPRCVPHNWSPDQLSVIYTSNHNV